MPRECPSCYVNMHLTQEDPPQLVHCLSPCPLPKYLVRDFFPRTKHIQAGLGNIFLLKSPYKNSINYTVKSQSCTQHPMPGARVTKLLKFRDLGRETRFQAHIQIHLVPEWCQQNQAFLAPSSIPGELSLSHAPTVRAPIQCPFIFHHIRGMSKIICLFFTERGREREREGKKHQSVAFCTRPLLGPWPTTQASALTGNRTCDPLVCRPVLNPLSHTSQARSTFNLQP